MSSAQEKQVTIRIPKTDIQLTAPEGYRYAKSYGAVMSESGELVLRLKQSTGRSWKQYAEVMTPEWVNNSGLTFVSKEEIVLPNRKTGVLIFARIAGARDIQFEKAFFYAGNGAPLISGDANYQAEEAEKFRADLHSLLQTLTF